MFQSIDETAWDCMTFGDIGMEFGLGNMDTKIGNLQRRPGLSRSHVLFFVTKRE